MIKIDIPFSNGKKTNRRFARKILIAAQRLFPGIPRVQRHDKFPSVSVAHTLVLRDISQPFSIPGNAIPAPTYYAADQQICRQSFHRRGEDPPLFASL